VSAGRAYRGSGWPDVPVERNPGAADRLPPDPRPEPLKLRLTGLVWLAAWELVRRLPEAWAHGLAESLGRLAHGRSEGARERVRRNLSRIMPPERLDATTRDAFVSYARYWVEAFRAADMDAADLDRRTTTNGFEHLDAVLDEGRGAIILLAHHGSWDLAAQWAETHGYHLAVVAEVVRPRVLFRRFVRLRESVGLEVVPLRRGEDMVGRLARVLEENHLVGLLAERDLTGKGVVVDFFGEATRIPRGAAVLAERSGAPVLPVTVLQRPGRRWHVEILPAFRLDGLTVEEGVARVTRGLEDIVRLDPAQWHAFQPVWLADLPEHHRGDWQPPEQAVQR
jgi:lauroyl/myristoyl acyltransferase